MYIAEHTEYYNKICKIAHDYDLNEKELSQKLNELLSGHNITLDTLDQYNRTFLHCAVLNHDIDVINLLIEEGASVHERDCLQYTPMHLAAAGNNTYIIQLLVNKGAYIDEEDWLGSTALHIAVLRNNEETVRLLINIGANVDEVNDEGCTALHVAIFDNNIHMAMLLIKVGADVNIKDINGQTTLYIAIIKNNINMVKLLMNAGAEINTKDHQKRTPLHIAVINNNLDMATFFVNLKANTKIKDCFRNTPLDCAQIKKNIDIIKLLTPININRPTHIHTFNNTGLTTNYKKLFYNHKVLCVCMALTLPLIIGAICSYLLGLKIATAFITGVMITIIFVVLPIRVLYNNSDTHLNNNTLVTRKNKTAITNPSFSTSPLDAVPSTSEFNL